MEEKKNKIDMEHVGMMTECPVKQESTKLWQYLATMSACFLAASAGTALAWTSPSLKKLEALNLVQKDSPEESWVGSLLAIGALFGALPTGSLADSLGRKKVLFLISIPYLISWALIGGAFDIWMIYVARVFVGIGVGASCVLVPTYISEISEISTKGALGAMFQLFMTLGIVLAFVAGPPLDLKLLSGICALVDVIFLITFFWMPESPVWLVTKKKKSEATRALRTLRGEEYDVYSEIADLQKDAERSGSRTTSVFDLIRTTASRKAFLICIAGMFFQQFSGINALVFYTANIFEGAGMEKENVDLAGVVVAFVQFIMSGLTILIIEKLGRKALMILSSSIAAVSLIALGAYFKMQTLKMDVSSITWLPLLSFVVFMIAFAIGLGPIPWMLTGELFPADLKGLASSIAVMVNWFLVFVITGSFQGIMAAIGTGETYWMFALCMIIASIFTLIVVPETKGKDIKEIQEELGGK